MKRINENDAPSRQQHIQVDMRRNPSDHLYSQSGFLDKDVQVKELECIDENNVKEVINDLDSSKKLVLSYDMARSKQMGMIFQSLRTNNKLKELTIKGCGDFEEDELYGNHDTEWGMILSAQRGGILPKDIFEMLNCNKTLTNLVISRKILWNSNKSFQDENPNTFLETSFTDFQDDLVELVKSSLHNNKSLTHIDLNSIGAKSPKSIETLNLINLEIKFNSCMSYFKNKFPEFSESYFLDSVQENDINFENLLLAAKFLKQCKGKFNQYEDFADKNFFFLSGVCKAHNPLSPLPLEIEKKCVHDLPFASFLISQNQPTECLGNLEYAIDNINLDS